MIWLFADIPKAAIKPQIFKEKPMSVMRHITFWCKLMNKPRLLMRSRFCVIEIHKRIK